MAELKNNVSVEEPMSPMEAVEEARLSGVPEERLDAVAEIAEMEHAEWTEAQAKSATLGLLDLDDGRIQRIQCVSSFPIWNGPRENGDRAGQNLRCDVLVHGGEVVTTFDAATDLKHAEALWSILQKIPTSLGAAQAVNYVGKEDGQPIATTQTPGGYFFANLRRMRTEAEREKFGTTEDFVADDLSNMS